MAIDNDSCSECEGNLIPTSDGKKCLESIENCEEYEISTVYSRYLQCNRCK